MSSPRTLSAMRQAIFTALTVSPLTYTVNADAPQTVSAANIFPMSPFDMGDGTAKPDPLINFEVRTRGRDSLQLPDRNIIITVWVSTASGSDDVVTEIMAAIFAILESPNADGVSPLSRAAAAGTLPIAVREIRELSSMAPKFETATQRIYADASFSAVAV